MDPNLLGQNDPNENKRIRNRKNQQNPENCPQTNTNTTTIYHFGNSHQHFNLPTVDQRNGHPHPGRCQAPSELSWWPPVEVPPNGLDRLWKRRQSAQATFVVAVFFQRTSDIKHMMKTCLLILAPLEDLNAGQNLPGACVYWFPKGLNHYPLSLNSILVAIWC